MYQKETESHSPIDTCTPMFIAAFYTVAKTWKQPTCPSRGERIKCHTHIHTQIQTNTGLIFSKKKKKKKKKKNPIATTWMELEGIMQSEIR